MGIFDFLKKNKGVAGGAVNKITSAIPGTMDDKIVAKVGEAAGTVGGAVSSATTSFGNAIPDSVQQQATGVVHSAENVAVNAAETVLNAADKVTDHIPGQADDKIVENLQQRIDGIQPPQQPPAQTPQA